MFKIDDTKCSNSTIISNQFCEYFIKHPENIHANIALSSYVFDHLIVRNPHEIPMPDVSPAEISHGINKLKKQGRLDDISLKFIKICCGFLENKLCELFNLCLIEGIFPDAFKLSKITPVHKKGPYNLIPNYRPISVLTNFCKIFESVIYDRISHFFRINEILSDKQYGFRKGKSTELSLLEPSNFSVNPGFQG